MNSLLDNILKNRRMLIVSLFILLIGIALLLIFMPRSHNQKPDDSSQTIRSPSPILSGPTNLPSTHPSVVTPLPFTGASLDLEFTDTEIKEIQEERELRHSSPYDGINFIIKYDDYADIFIVTLYAPKSQTRQQFEQWKDLTFPHIKQDRFIFQ